MSSAWDLSDGCALSRFSLSIQVKARSLLCAKVTFNCSEFSFYIDCLPVLNDVVVKHVIGTNR